METVRPQGPQLSPNMFIIKAPQATTIRIILPIMIQAISIPIIRPINHQAITIAMAKAIKITTTTITTQSNSSISQIMTATLAA
jgi:hypothetical protein